MIPSCIVLPRGSKRKERSEGSFLPQVRRKSFLRASAERQSRSTSRSVMTAVLVTGASGFIALHVIRLLQREGYRVRGTVRSLACEAKVQPLRSLCPEARHPLELVEADLTSDAGWERAVAGCTYVLHIASPFPKQPPKSEADLIIPAVEGTKRVLRAAAAEPTVRRVVLTSSISAVHGQNTCPPAGKVLTEDDWTNLQAADLEAYGKSKTMAEKVAWEFVRSLPADRGLELATVNPSLVMGPSISGVVCTSLELIKRMMDGSMPLIPRLNIALCDVRDVAEAHLKAMTIPEAANNRHLINSGHLWLQDIAHILRNEFGPQGYFIPTWPAPYPFLWIYSIVDVSTRLILQRVDQEYIFSNRRMKEVLSVEPRKPEEVLIDTVHGFIECGVIKKTKNYVPKK